MRIKHPYGFRLRRHLTRLQPFAKLQLPENRRYQDRVQLVCTNLWFPSVNWRASRLMARGLGASSNTIVRNRCWLWVEQLPIKTNGCKPADHLVHCSSHILRDQWPKSIGPLLRYRYSYVLFPIENIWFLQTELGSAARNKKHERAYAPRPSAQRSFPSALICVDKTCGSRDSTELHNGPLP